jgi:hypothetical protein
MLLGLLLGHFAADALWPIADGKMPAIAVISWIATLLLGFAAACWFSGPRGGCNATSTRAAPVVAGGVQLRPQTRVVWTAEEPKPTCERRWKPVADGDGERVVAGPLGEPPRPVEVSSVDRLVVVGGSDLPQPERPVTCVVSADVG